MRITFLIDGFNLYHSLKKASFVAGLDGHGTRWLNLWGLCSANLYQFGKSAAIQDVYYFSAIAAHRQAADPGTVSRHHQYIQCLEASGVQVVLGRFKTKKVWCDHCEQMIVKHEEKETDVSISVTLMKLLMQKSCDAIVIVTGDTDMAPAVRMAQEIFPGNRIGFLFPFYRKNKELARISPDFAFKLSEQSYIQNQFPDPFVLPNGKHINKPAIW